MSNVHYFITLYTVHYTFVYAQNPTTVPFVGAEKEGRKFIGQWNQPNIQFSVIELL